MRRWSCLRDGLRRKEKIRETAEKDHSMNLPFTKQIQLRYRLFSIQHSIYRMSLCCDRVTLGGNMKKTGVGTGAQRGDKTCLRSHTLKVRELPLLGTSHLCEDRAPKHLVLAPSEDGALAQRK